ncbi:hypothetical protein NHH03_02550 [Stieleria sp. TO1_6]|uniref:PVC-type heme-binding CxxCH protein n=1 Tax=Stieleria tagensis TaxID=2956795 RepID=UPI00209B09A1|nr:PVC-type heme-binding CxxCH protein [Stieleria tagensis]MCO8120603.1 hypothetical protein [Stieleria tagensis]
MHIGCLVYNAALQKALLPREFAVTPIRFLLTACVLFCAGELFADPPQPPLVVDPDWQIELVRSEPDIVTPVACAFDSAGRLLVIESHTHFPPDNYSGPKTDRIHLLADSDGDGSLDDQSIFYEGGIATMGLAILQDNWIAVANRSEVIRIKDSTGDGKADLREVLLRLNTVAEYPHNGLAGLVMGPDGWLYVGQGENFGEPYELIASDGTKQIGGGEGGNIFRIRPDGSNLQRVATGFWNPFGMCFDSAERLWTVGNDPDAMPPCRLLQVVPGGDYGFQFRFGRAGTHPLLAWNGELPGTLPFAAGTGEAPCAVMPVADRLWVTSWGDNRVEAYRLSAEGASWKSQTETIVQGDTDFRPVGIAQAADGSIYVTDWVRRDYSVHQTGRIWRLSRKQSQPDTSASSLPELTTAEKLAQQIAKSNDRLAIFEALDDQDPFVRQAATTALAEQPNLKQIDWSVCQTSGQQIGLLAAWRWLELSDPSSITVTERQRLLRQGLASQFEGTVLLALRWSAERGEQSLLDNIQTLLSRPSISPKLFESAVATISYLKGGTSRGVRDPVREKLLSQLAADTHQSASIRAMAVRMIPADSNQPSDSELLQWAIDSRSDQLVFEIVRLLNARSGDAAINALAELSANDHVTNRNRAAAVSGLAKAKQQQVGLLNRLESESEPEMIREEARRVLADHTATDQSAQPDATDLSGWMKQVGDGGDPEAGGRVFSRSICIRCHAYSGRGATTGPDLTSLGGQTRERLLESILNPSKEVGPLYVPWKILTVDGKVLAGLKTATPGVGQKLSFQGADGEPFLVGLEEIEQHSFSDQSIMPAGLQKTMSIDELRDLLAFLSKTE